MAGGTQVNLSSNPQISAGSKLDLKLIDESYGSNADLYEDVLRVATNATQDEIQLAYFDRRSELFTLLAKIDAAERAPRSQSSMANAEQQRYLAERKMDSVVFAVRILADSSLRRAYNEIRHERTGIPSTSGGYTLVKGPQSASNSSFPSISPSNSAASESSTKSNGRGKKYNTDVKQPTPRAVTPPETPPVTTTSSSASESRNWIQSTFSSSIFSSISNNSSSKHDDDAEEYETDERNPRKSKRRSKQNQVSSSSSRDREAEPVNEPYPEKEKKSIWGRKKRKKKKRSKEELEMLLDESMDTNATDTSMTDHDESHTGSRTRNIDANPTLSTKSSVSTNDYRVSPQEAVSRRERSGFETIGDDSTRQDDDTRTFLGDDGETFATVSVFSEEYQAKGSCGDDGMFGCISGSRTFQKIASEVSGACEDTLVSVDQVFHAFTLTDKDIKAVKKKIDKAKKQLDN